MSGWLRTIFGFALVVGLAYLTWQVSVHIDLTRFMLESPEARAEPYIIPIVWVWSSIPISLLWCSVAFYGFTSGMGIRKTRLVVLAAGVLAIATLIAFVLALVLIPVTKV